MPRYIYAIWEKKTCFCFVDTSDYNIEQKIEFEIKMRDGTQKLLSACKHSSQTLEAEKSLLVSNNRINTLVSELHRRRRADRNAKNCDENLRGSDLSKAKVSISDIRIPLIWKDSDHFKNKGDYRRFAVFCIIKVGAEVCDTMMLEDVDRTMTDITFDDICVFANIAHDFQFQLELYSRVLDDLSIASAHAKLSKRISSSISKTFGRKLANAIKDDYNSSQFHSKFNLIASSTLSLRDASDAIKTHDLVVENAENRNNHLPLFGHFCCRLAVKPECQTRPRLCGYLRAKQLTARVDKLESDIYWASLGNFQLRLWCTRGHSCLDGIENIETIEHDLAIPINGKTLVESGANAVRVSSENACLVLSIPDGVRDRIETWTQSIRQAKVDFLNWEPIVEYKMEIPSPSLSGDAMFVRPKLSASLYEETEIAEFSPKSQPLTRAESNTKSLSRVRRPLSKSDSFRSRSLSLSSSCTTSSSATNSGGKRTPQTSSTESNGTHLPIINERNSFLYGSRGLSSAQTSYY